MNNIVSYAKISDIRWMVELSETKRQNYEKYQPNFWKKNPDSAFVQTQYFEELLIDKILSLWF